jgi:hypothetical protein
MPPGLITTLNAIGIEPDRERFADVENRLGSFAALVKIRSRCSAEIDAADLGPSELKDWLLARIPESEVVIAWVADRVGARMNLTLFADNVDDLWYPSMDDVVIMDDAQGILVLGHEERFTFTRLGP